MDIQPYMVVCESNRAGVEVWRFADVQSANKFAEQKYDLTLATVTVCKCQRQISYTAQRKDEQL